MTETEISDIRSSYKALLEAELSKAPSYIPTIASAPMLAGQWSGIVWPASTDAVWDPDTGVEKESLVKIGRASVAVSQNFVSIRPFIPI